MTFKTQVHFSEDSSSVQRFKFVCIKTFPYFWKLISSRTEICWFKIQTFR